MYLYIRINYIYIKSVYVYQTYPIIGGVGLVDENFTFIDYICSMSNSICDYELQV